MIRFRLFTIVDFDKQENFLRQMHRQGWCYTKTYALAFHHFVPCQPEDVIYKLDFQKRGDEAAYQQLFLDYGWEFVTSCLHFKLFRKPAYLGEADIFSDTSSRMDMIKRLFWGRFAVVLMIFMTTALPGLFREHGGNGRTWLPVIVIYLLLFAYSGHGFYRLYRQYRKN